MTVQDRKTAPEQHGIGAAFQGAWVPPRWTLGALWRPLARQSTARGWRTTVGKVVKDLENLNRSTERDFLAVGEKLIEFRLAARRVASDMAALTELISGEQGRAASHALTRMLGLTGEMDGRIERSGQALEQVRGLSCRIRLAFAGLHNTVSVFRALCTLTQIETSRLGSTGADFGDLAAEVRPLSENIQSSGEGVLEISSQLDQGARTAIQSGSELRSRQLKELPALIAAVVESLSSLEERRQRAAEASARQAAQYDAVCGSIDDVVKSVQSHDITRQQIEHVVDALRRFGSAGDGGRGNRDALPPEARAILTLQSSQLSGAAGIFASSVERMERDLENIAGRVQHMAEASRTLMGISADDQDSFFLRMESHFTAILTMLGACAAAQSEMGQTGATLADTIGRMRASIAEIRGIEIRIQRIATNATIRATHIGAAGDPLNVIAEVMQRLALDSNTNTEDVAGALDTMGDAANRVAFGGGGGGLGDAGSAADSGAREITGEMRQAVAELHVSSECSFSRVNQIAALAERLAGDAGAVRGGFTAGPLFAQVVARAREELGRIAAQAGGGSRGSAGAAPAHQLESLAIHYTMQRERDIHESVARGSAPVHVATPVPAQAPTQAPPTALAEGDLGDNVELF